MKDVKIGRRKAAGSSERWHSTKELLTIAAVVLVCGNASAASPELEAYARDFKQGCVAYTQKKNPQAPATGNALCECASQKYLSVGDDDARRLLAGDKEIRSRLDGDFLQSCLQRVVAEAAQEGQATKAFVHAPSPLPNLLETKSGAYLDGRANRKIAQVVEDGEARAILALKTGEACLVTVSPLRSMGRIDAASEAKLTMQLTMLLRLASEDPSATIGAQQVSKVRNMPARLFEATTKIETLGKVEKTNYYGAYVVDETNDAGVLALCWNEKGTRATVKKESLGFISDLVGSARRY